MTSTLSTADRGLRAGVFALVSTTLAVGAHWAGSGMVPTLPVISAAALVLTALGWWLAARPRGAAALVGVTVLSQLLLHTAFAASMARGGMPAMSLILCGHGPTPAGAFPAGTPLSLAGGHTAGLQGVSTGHGLVMLSGHVLAAALVGLWLRAGEQVLARIPALIAATRNVLRRVIQRLLPPDAAPRPHHRGFAVTCRPRHLRDHVVGSLGLRGPPLWPSVSQPC